MAELITLEDIKHFSGTPRIVVPKGTILTPSAKDWAREKGIEIQFEEPAKEAQKLPADSKETRQSVIDTCLWLEEMGLTIGTWAT